MKKPLFSVAAALLLGTAALAATPQNEPAHPAARSTTNDSHGYAKSHQVTPREKTRRKAAPTAGHPTTATAEDKARWEARKNNQKAKNDSRQTFNYGYDKTHQVTADEKAKWEAAHEDARRPDGRQNERR